MGRGFHWFEGLEYAFIALVVLLAIGVSADGFSELSVLSSITNLFFALLEVAAALLALPSAVVGIANGLGAIAFFGLFIAGLLLFRERIFEIGVVALIALFAISVLFGGIY